MSGRVPLVAVRAAQIVIGVLLVWAALAKLGDVPAFARDIHHYRLLPPLMENLLAMALPWIELVAGLSLLLGIRPRAGALVAAALLVVVTAAVALALARGIRIECGCFGAALAWRVDAPKLLVNVAMLALAMIGVLRPGAGEASPAS